jgi:hypothetical protein
MVETAGALVITNFELELGADGKHLDEPGWHREKDGKAVDKPTAIRADMETCIHNLLTLGEDVFVSWAQRLQHSLAKAANEKKLS